MQPELAAHEGMRFRKWAAISNWNAEPVPPIPSSSPNGDNSKCGIPCRSEALNSLSQAILRSLLLPGGALLLGVVALVSLGWLTLALPALSFLYYCAIVGGMLLAWRFHSSRIFVALCVCSWRKERSPYGAEPSQRSSSPQP